jgi:hypothetical protein
MELKTENGSYLVYSIEEDNIHDNSYYIYK